jgi:hypothetical protein
MAIVFNVETRLSLAVVARPLPKCRGAKWPQANYIHRPTSVGCRGIIGESILLDGTRSLDSLAFGGAPARHYPFPTHRGWVVGRDVCELERETV